MSIGNLLHTIGVECEIETDAEISLSSNGTIYGVVTSAKVTHLKAGRELGKEFEDVSAYLPFVEPILVEMLTDLPFSYQIRNKGDRLTILNYRALLAGPNPLAKLSIIGVDSNDKAKLVFHYFQIFSSVMEGNYTAVDPVEVATPKKRTPFRKTTDVPKQKTRSLTPERIHGGEMGMQYVAPGFSGFGVPPGYPTAPVFLESGVAEAIAPPANFPSR